MIGRLTGVLAGKQPPGLLIDVNGVGYELESPMSTFYELPPVGDRIQLLTHLIVKDDGHYLYGFLHSAERELFRSLLRISGVGAKLALAILSGVSVQEFTDLVHHGDVAALKRVPGIGQKTAERLILEMRDRLDKLPSADPALVSGPAGTGARGSAAEAIEALIALGYKPPEASRLIKKVAEPDLTTEQIIRLALKQAAGK